MNTAIATSSRALRAISIGGGIAGFCDIAYAIVFWLTRGVSPVRVLQSVASGLLGAKAFEGGAATAALGLALHFVIALIFAAFFWGVSRRWRTLTAHAVAWGALYGFMIFWVMNLVVLPLSAFPRAVSFAPWPTITGLIVHAFLIGVPIALAARRGQRAQG